MSADARAADPLAERLCWAGLLGIALVACARCLIVFTPDLWFDVDPAAHGTPLAGFAITGSLCLDVAGLLACAVALAGERRAGRGLDVLLLGLALLPVPVILWHGGHDGGSLWRGSTWIVAALSAVAVAHLARDRLRRAVLVGLLLGIIGPLLARGALQMTVEHGDTVAAFEATRERFLAQRGWEPDSPAAQIYERRLRQAQPVGWFATTNVLASLAGYGLVAAVGLCGGAWRRRLPGGWAATFALVGLALAATLILSGAKGAIGATLAGVLVLVAAWSAPRWAATLARWRGVLALGLVAAVIAAVMVRGVLLPEGFAGDRSLLFRWHYLQGAAASFVETPLVGAGPDGFQEAYAVHRPPRSPEEVVSAHGAVADWMATLGASGAAWVLLLGALVWVRGRRGRDDDDGPYAALGPPGAPPRDAAQRAADAAVDATALQAALVVGAVAVGLGMLAEWSVLDVLTSTVRVIGALSFVAIAAIAASTAWRLRSADLFWCATAAAVVLLVHGQIEMTFFSPGASVWAMAAVGAAGVVSRRPPRRLGGAAPLLVLVLAGWIVVGGVVPAARQQALVRRAAASVFPPADGAWSQVRQRLEAISLLEQAYEAWPANARPLRAAARQAMIAAETVGEDGDLPLLERAVALASRDAASTSGVVLAADAQARLALRRGDEASWREAERRARAVIERDPQAIVSWTRLGDVLWEAGRRPEAADAYRRALERSDDFELDPLKQLAPRRRASIERRIADG